MMLSVAEIARALGPTLRSHSGAGTPLFRRAIIDSREAAPGDLFVALPGQRVDGHDFVADAAAHGAEGAIVQRPIGSPSPDFALFETADSLAALQALAAHWRSGLHTHVIGVTGSVGKTSCKELTAAVLGVRYRVYRSTANQNNEIGLPLAVLAIEREHEFAVLEMGMYARGEIATLARIARPETGVVTNVGPVHLERIGSMEAIADAKAELIEALPADGLAVLNGDDARVSAIAARTAARIVRYGTTPGCDVRGSNAHGHGLDGVSFTLSAGGEQTEVRVAIPGAPGMVNAMAAAAVALNYGMTLPEIAVALTEARPYRLRVVAGPGGSVLLDDTYNASPPSVLAALDLLADLSGRRIAVLGDMLELGSYEERGHREVGQRAAQVADILIAIGERSVVTAEAARKAGLKNVTHFPVRAGVADVLRKTLRSGDHVLFKGSRGMALETVIAELTAPANGGEKRGSA
ncbi:MAG: UDP-N-acetylmuramoyl-tripeptide--D-alanyl-D-alanine ligase [Dehalococcoidia bacterium]|nr:UDP-N-acetylmuramoyl-tripeptide--D-alanyl-D-alanine ligase [Dehalococcoidia bacterium]